MATLRSSKLPKQVSTLTHDEATRRNIPTAELQSTAEYLEEMNPSKPVAYQRARPLAQGERRERDEDLDPQIVWNGARIRLTRAQVDKLAETGEVEIGDAQLVWRGKDTQDWSDLIIQTPPLYIQEKIHPKAIIDDLKRRSETASAAPDTIDLFADFNGIDAEAKTEFYQHDQHWSNRMILGDSLQVMASLAEREHLAGKVQCIYFDPPYGIKFNSNWQVSTQNRDVKDGKQADISREPEQVKAFRDTWKDGIHSYLTYLRDRLTVMRELLTETGSIFVQIGDENVHRVRAVLDEVFGGVKGGPARKKTLELLRASGRALDVTAYEQIAEALRQNPGANPWHVCYAVAMCWGRLARLDPDFVQAAVASLDTFDPADVATACEFPFEKGPTAVRDSLHGGWIAFSKAGLSGPLPTDLPGMVRAQAKWLRTVLSDKPRFVGAWNGTALFMVALFANPKLAESMIEPEVVLPIGGPITAGLNILHQAHLSVRPPEPKEEDESLDFGQIMLINGQFAEIRRGLADWSLVEVHSGLYMLGTRLPESRAWYP